MEKFNHTSGQHLEIDGAKIYFEEIGNKEKPLLLMLHGGFEDIENLNSIASYLSEHFRILGIDARGHGRSTLGDHPLTYKQMQADVEAILEHLKISTVNILGFSDGGTVAYRIAASNRVKVNKLIAIGTSWSQKDDFEALTQSIVSLWLDRTESGHPDESVRDITANTLLIRGDNDFLVSLESLMELKGKIKNSSLMNVPFAEHVVYEAQPQLTKIVIQQFLDIV